MFITIMTPTYNRGHLLGRVHASLIKQSCKDFEWLIVDDGSTDDTENLVQSFQTASDFPITYVKKGNEGKVSAINDALNLARGDWFAVLDSDDWCSNDAIEQLKKLCGSNQQYGSISTLKATEDGKIVGEIYEKYKNINNYIDRFNAKVKGDKWEIIKTSIHRRCRYDIAEGEKYMAPEYAWLKVGALCDTLFFDKPLCIVEYQEDGISMNNIKHRISSPGNAVRFYRLALSNSNNMALTAKSLLNLLRFKLHRMRSLGDILSIAFFPSLLLYFFDLWSVRKLGNRK